MNDNLTKQEWVLVRKVGGDVTFNATPSGKSETLVSYNAKGFTAAVVGGRYEVEANLETGRARIAGAKYLGKISDEATVVRYEADQEARRIAAAARTRQVKDKDDKALLRLMEPLRNAYARLPYTERLALEVAILSYLRRAV